MTSTGQFDDRRGERRRAESASFRSKAKPFLVDMRFQGPVTFVAPVGELDMATVDRLDEALGHAIESGCRSLVLDLRGLTFMDSTGLHLVLRWHALAEEGAISLAIMQGGPGIRRLFEIVGLTDGLPFVDHVAAHRLVTG